MWIVNFFGVFEKVNLGFSQIGVFEKVNLGFNQIDFVIIVRNKLCAA